MAKKMTAAVFIGLFLVLNIEATTVSFFVIETGLPQEGGRNRHSALWEDSLMDVFFDAGYIVSNAPMLRIDTRPSEIYKLVCADIEEAGDGGADFIIIAQLDFIESSQPPQEIALFLFSINAQKKIYEKRMSGKKYKTDRDEIADLKKFAGDLIPFLTK